MDGMTPMCQGLTREQSKALYVEMLEDGGTEALATLAKQDLFFLLTVPLRRRDVDCDWLFDRCREVEAEPNHRLDLWAREHYKDLASDTPVLTKRGWVNHGDLAVGDSVRHPAGGWTTVVATRHFTDSACRRMEFRGGASIVCGAGHLWQVESKTGHALRQRKTEVVRTDDIPGPARSPRIPCAAVTVGRDVELPVDPYVLGVWLGDGDSTSGRICGIDPQVFEEVERRGYELSHNHCPSRVPFRACTVYGLSAGLRELGLFGCKRIPPQYLAAGSTVLLDLLRGLMDTDGSVSGGSAIFAQKDRGLCEDLVGLVAGLGWKPRLSPCRGTGSWHVSWAVGEADPSPFYLQRKTDKLPKRPRNHASTHWYIQSIGEHGTVPTNCIQVAAADGMYCAGRQLIPTHNSTIITFAYTIQDILRDPDVTIGIFSHTRPIAKAFLSQIMREFEENDFLKRLFPGILWENPRRQSPCWSLDNGVLVKRKSNNKEKTVEAWGLVDGQPIGKHFKVLIYDDVVTEEGTRNPEMIEKTTKAWEMSLNLGAHGGTRRFIGTRYHLNDTYRVIIDRGTVTPRIYTATEDGTPTGKAVFLTAEALAEKRRDMGPHTFSSQMLQNPLADAVQGFREDWLQFYDAHLFNIAGMNTYILVDPASEKKKTSDYTVMAVIALAPDGNYYLVDAIRDRLNLTQRADALFRLVAKWRPLAVGYEKYGLQADIEHIQFVQELRNFRFKIVPLGGQTPKNDRIRRLVPVFEQGRFYMPKRLMFVDLEGKARDFVDELVRDEYNPFPVGVHDDMMDCLARILEQDLGAQFPQRRAPGALPTKANTTPPKR